MTRTVLITGCSSGIGEATAREFDDRGWKVYATARNPDDVDVGDEHLELDVTDEQEVDDAVETAVENEGRIDAVVNNAGDPLVGAVEETDIEEARSQFDVNFHGPHRLVRATLPHMRRQGDGTVVNVSSLAGRVAPPGMGTYSASKHALEALSDALRVEVSGFGVDVVLVEPGPIETDFVEDTVEELDYDGAYAEVHESLRGYAESIMTSPQAVPPEKVARKIANAAEEDDPKARYTVGRGSRLLASAEYLPSSVRDRAHSLMMRF